MLKHPKGHDPYHRQLTPEMKADFEKQMGDVLAGVVTPYDIKEKWAKLALAGHSPRLRLHYEWSVTIKG